MIEKAKSQWIDISLPLRNSMVHWPGDPPVSISRVKDMERGDHNNLSVISMGTHSGTHMDAPRHFFKEGTGIDKMSLDITIGRARVIQIQDTQSVKVEELVKHNLCQGERILFKTQNSLHAWDKNRFIEDFVFISDEAAQFIAKRRIRLVGIDYLSVGSSKSSGSLVHRTLLGGGVWIIEGLDLSQLPHETRSLACRRGVLNAFHLYTVQTVLNTYDPQYVPCTVTCPPKTGPVLMLD